MRSLLLSVAMASTLCAAPAFAQEREVPISYQVKMAPAAVEAALAAFGDACPPLLERYIGDVATMEATVRAAYPREERLGSRTVIDLVVTLSQQPRAIPPTLAAKHRAARQRCHYTLYGGAQPRVEVGKEICKAVCGLDPAASGAKNAVMPAPALAVIER